MSVKELKNNPSTSKKSGVLSMHTRVANGDEVYGATYDDEEEGAKFETEKLTLSWENIDVHLPPPGGCGKLPCCRKEVTKTQILQNVKGIAKPGELLAIMGASGAGKTTLLNLLNFRNQGNLRITGEIRINGLPINGSSGIAAISGYVQQDELFIGTLTVREHLLFQAMLRMDKEFNNEQRKKRVDDVLAELNLKKCATTRIGIPEKNIKGISGGERRRLAFASEIITNPSLLFCDEPTSGLDSFMALSVVESMKTLAREGKTIICTIHQPSSETFDKFDKLCLMAEGRLAFLGSLKDALNYFSNVGYPCPQNYNPADHYIQTLAISPADRQKSFEVVKKVCDEFQTSKYASQLNSDLKTTTANASSKNGLESLNKNPSGYKSGFFVQLVWLLWRATLSKYRDVLSTQISIIQTIVIAVLLGLIFLQIKVDQAGIQNINGVLFLMISNNSFSTMFAVINSFPAELPIFFREHKNRMYTVLTYYIAKFLVDLPFFIVLPLISTSIIYWMANLNNDVGRFFTCVAMLILVGNISVAFGSFLSAVAPSVNAALGLSAPILVPLMIFSGIFLNNSTVPSYFIWLKYLSWLSYSYEVLSINQWSGVTNITCTTTASRCLSNGDQILAQLSMEKANWGNDWIALCALLVGWRILTFFVLLLKAYLNK